MAAPRMASGKLIISFGIDNCLNGSSC